MVPLASMTNILSDDKRQEVLALGRLGWTLRHIQRATGVRRETAGAYLKAAGLTVQPPGRWGHPTAKPAIEVSTDSSAHPPGISSSLSAAAPPGRAPAASACEPYRELIEAALGRGRDAMAIWRDLVDDHGFPAQYASVRRFALTLRGRRPAEAHPRVEPHLPVVPPEHRDRTLVSGRDPRPRAPAPRPSRPQPRMPHPRWSRRHSSFEGIRDTCAGRHAPP